MSRLTDVTIAAIKPPETGQAVYKDAGSPLQLRVSAGGAKTFFTVVGNGRRHTIGRWGEVPLAKAREVARRIRAEKTLGRYASQSVPIERAKEEYLAKLTVRPNTRRSYAHYLALLKTTDTREITRLLDPMTPRVRNQALLTYKTFFKWCLRRDYLERSPVEKLEFAKVSPRTRLLTDEEIGRIWRACEQNSAVGESSFRPDRRTLPTSFCTIVKLLILTGQRRNEIASIQPSWIKNETITIPAIVTKNKREHLLPLATLAFETLRQFLSDSRTTRPEAPRFLFPARAKTSAPFNDWSRNKAALDRRLGGTVAPWTLHDIRRYYASTMARLGVKQEVTERLLNHRSGIISGIAAVYTLHDFMPEMRQAVERYEQHLRQPLDLNQ